MDAPESKPLRKHWLMRILLSKAFIISVALVITYTLVGFFLAPYLIKRQVKRFAQKSLKCLVVMEEVRVNPYALTLDIRNFDLKERDGSPLLAFKAFFINFETSSLWRWAWTFADVRLEDPVVNLEIEGGNRVNFIELADRIPRKENEGSASRQQKTEGETRPPRVIFEHIALNQGRLVFTDRSGPTPGGIALEAVGLELKNLTTLPGKKGIHSFEATLPHGGKLRLAGDVSLHPLWSEGRVEVEGFKIVSAWEFLQDEILLDKPGGKVDLEARYRFANEAKSPSLVIEELKVLVSALELKARGEQEPTLSVDTIRLDDGRFDLASRSILAENLNVLFAGVSLKEVGQETPLVTLESLAAEGGRLDLETRQVTLERIMVEGGHAAMVLDKAGAVNLLRVLGRS
ncbi:DUF748 domain-containing protein, partial [Thermodesulfobacteriota bacterium]